MDKMRFRSDPSALRGSLAAVMTPFTDEGELDVAGLAALARWQRDAGADGLSIGGSTGEPSSQSTNERIAAMRTVADVAGDQVPFVPATGSTKLDETLELTAAARDMGADAALVITPYYSKPTQEGLLEWYATVAGEFPDLPVIVYNVPTRTSVDLAPETALRLRRRCDNVVGIKETTKDFEHFSQVLYRCGRDFLVWSGIELLGLPLLALGGAGFISALSNLAPRSLADMYRHWQRGELDEAARVHYRLHPLVDLLFVETNPAPAKWVLQRAGRLASAKVRPPLVSPGLAAQQRILDLLDEAKAVVDYEQLTLG
jgi:4-hydroxy-tetrahydrodipicolinate synthase